jgi:hypothetical protein
MNSYPRQIPPPSSLLGRSTPLNTVEPSELLPGQSGPYVDHPAFSAKHSRAAPGPPCGAPIVANTIGQFGFTTGQTGYAYTEPIVAHYAPNYYTPQHQYVPPPTYLNYNAPYDHRSINIINRSRQESGHSNARPNEPQSPGSDGLPPGAMEKIREEMAELFRDRLEVRACLAWLCFNLEQLHSKTLGGAALLQSLNCFFITSGCGG